MGVYQEKYTEEYYTSHSKSGEALDYGPTANRDQNGIYTLRDHDNKILDKVSFHEKNVLCLGCGRGEEAVYALAHGAKHCICCDFSETAIGIAKETAAASGVDLEKLEFYCADAMDFLDEYHQKQKTEAACAARFDIVIMLDFLEHVPRAEMGAIFSQLHEAIAPAAILVINTPCYKYDNDVLRDGLDPRNQVNCCDTSDQNPATAGMHCNKYTCVSLQIHLLERGYTPVSEAHYFVRSEAFPSELSKISYRLRWIQAKAYGVSICGDYEDDEIEYPYADACQAELIQFEKGVLSGIRIIATREYCRLAFQDGEIDHVAIQDFAQSVRGKEALTVFDVGGFIGTNALVYARIIGKTGKVVVFEPNPYNRNRLFINLSHNPDLDGCIIVESFALGNQEGAIDMTLSANIDSGHSSTSRIQGAHAKISDSGLPEGFFQHAVTVTTLDSYVAASGNKPDIIKVDIEGAEYMLLLGAIETIRNAPILYIEYHSEYVAAMCTQLLNQCGYTIYPCQEEPDNRVIIKAQVTGDSAAGDMRRDDHIGQLLQSLGWLRDKYDALSADAADAKQALCVTKQDLRTAKQDLRAMESAYQSVIHSHSWKLTAPLRAIMDRLRASK